MYKCFHCGLDSVEIVGVSDAEEYGDDLYGVIMYCICSNCKTEYEVYIPDYF